MEHRNTTTTIRSKRSSLFLYPIWLKFQQKPLYVNLKEVEQGLEQSWPWKKNFPISDLTVNSKHSIPLTAGDSEGAEPLNQSKGKEATLSSLPEAFRKTEIDSPPPELRRKRRAEQRIDLPAVWKQELTRQGRHDSGIHFPLEEVDDRGKVASFEYFNGSLEFSKAQPRSTFCHFGDGMGMG